MIPENLVEQIREEANIVDVVGDYVELEKRGRNHFGLCPFHQEDTPSFSVNEEKQIYYCFGCHEGGNAFNFLMKLEGMSFPESVMKVASFTGVDVGAVEMRSSAQSQKTKKLKPYYDILKFVSDYYEYMVVTDQGRVGQEYLKQRGIDEKTRKHFGIGYAPPEHLLAEMLKKNDFDIEKAKEIGLIHESNNMLQHYDAFADRLIFPIKDNDGHHVAFTGRLVIAKENAAKYYHSHESVVFKKREVLYNYHAANTAIRRSKSVYIAEGIFDVIALHRAGIENVVATLGTALTVEQINFLKKNRIQPIFIFDNDSAGKNATMKAFELAQQHELEAQAVIFWEYTQKDLDDLFAETDRSTLQNIVKKKYNIFDYALLFYKEKFNLDNNEDRQSFSKEILKLLDGSNQATKEFYYEELKDLTNYSMQALLNLMPQQKAQTSRVDDRFEHLMPPPMDEFESYSNVQSKPVTPMRIPTIKKQDRQTTCELLIIKGFTESNEYIKQYQGNPVLSQNHFFRKIVYEMIEMYRKHHQVDVGAMYEKLTTEEAKFFSEAINRKEPMSPEIFEDLLATLKTTSEARFFKEEARRADSNLEQQKKSIQELLDYRRKNNK